MNPADRVLLFQIAEIAPCNFADISLKTQAPTVFLNLSLASLVARGWLECDEALYTVPQYALNELLVNTEGSAVNT